MAEYIKTEHGEFKASFVQSLSSFDKCEKADILRGHYNRKEVLKKLWEDSFPEITTEKKVKSKK